MPVPYIGSMHNYGHTEMTPQDWEIARKMYEGPFLQDGEIRIPSYIFHPGLSQAAAAEWKKNGFRFDGAHKEWVRKMPADQAPHLLAKVRKFYFNLFYPNSQGLPAHTPDAVDPATCAHPDVRYETRESIEHEGTGRWVEKWEQSVCVICGEDVDFRDGKWIAKKDLPLPF